MLPLRQVSACVLYHQALVECLRRKEIVWSKFGRFTALGAKRVSLVGDRVLLPSLHHQLTPTNHLVRQEVPSEAAAKKRVC